MALSHLQMRSQQWDAKGRPKTQLLQGDDAKEKEIWVKEAFKTLQQPPPVELQIAYVDACKRNREGQKRQRKVRACLSVLCFFGLLCVTM